MPQLEYVEKPRNLKPFKKYGFVTFLCVRQVAGGHAHGPSRGPGSGSP